MMSIEFLARIHFYRTEDGGHAGDVTTGYRPSLVLGATESECVLLFQDKTEVPPGGRCLAIVKLTAPAPGIKDELHVGAQCDVREGDKTVGNGTILEIFKLEP